MRVRERVVEQPRRDEPGGVRHVHPQDGADLVGDLAERGVVEVAAVGARADAQHPRHHLVRPLADAVEVELPRQRPALLDAVEVGVVELAGEVDRRAVREVAAMSEVEPEEFLAGLHEGEVDRLVGRRAGVRLHVDPVGAEELLGAVSREVLHHVDLLAAAVVALARQALGVLVGQRAAERLEHGGADEVLGGDELEAVVLPLDLAADGLEDLGILTLERVHDGAGVGVPEGRPAGRWRAPPRGRFTRLWRGRRTARTTGLSLWRQRLLACRLQCWSPVPRYSASWSRTRTSRFSGWSMGTNWPAMPRNFHSPPSRRPLRSSVYMLATP